MCSSQKCSTRRSHPLPQPAITLWKFHALTGHCTLQVAVTDFAPWWTLLPNFSQQITTAPRQGPVLRARPFMTDRRSGIGTQRRPLKICRNWSSNAGQTHSPAATKATDSCGMGLRGERRRTSTRTSWGPPTETTSIKKSPSTLPTKNWPWDVCRRGNSYMTRKTSEVQEVSEKSEMRGTKYTHTDSTSQKYNYNYLY